MTGQASRIIPQVCRNTGRCVRNSRGAFYVRYLEIRYAESWSVRRRTRFRIDPSKRGKSDNPRGDTAKVLNIQRASEIRRKGEKERDGEGSDFSFSGVIRWIRQHSASLSTWRIVFHLLRRAAPTNYNVIQNATTNVPDEWWTLWILRLVFP